MSMKNEQYEILMELPAHPLFYELQDWLQEGNPVQGWLMMLSDEEFSIIHTLCQTKPGDGEPRYTTLAFLVSRGKIPILGEIVETIELRNGVAKLHTIIELESLRRKGLVEAVDMPLDDDEWIWRKVDKLED